MNASMHENDCSDGVGSSSDNAMMNLKLKFIHEEAIALTVERDISISNLKQRIFDTTGTAIDLQRLIYKGKVLRDHLCLYNYNFVDGDTIHVVASQRPTTPPVPSPAPSTQASVEDHDDPGQMSFQSLMETLVGSNDDTGSRPTTRRGSPFIAMTFEPPPRMRTSNTPSRSTARRDFTTPQDLLEQAIHLRQAATRLSSLPMISLHPHQARLASSLNEFSHSLLILSRQVSSLAWALNRLDSERDLEDASIQGAISETLNLLGELGAFSTPLRQALSDLVRPPPTRSITVVDIVRVPEENTNRPAEAPSGNLILTLLQAVGNAVRGTRDAMDEGNSRSRTIALPAPPAASTSASTNTARVQEVHEHEMEGAMSTFIDARTPLLANDTPLTVVLDVVYGLMQSYFVPPHPLHALPEEFVAGLHRPLQHVVQSALGFSDQVAPSYLNKRIKTWAKAATRQYEGWLADALSSEAHVNLPQDCSDGMHCRLFVRLANLILLPPSSHSVFASEMQLLGRRFLSALLHVLLNLPSPSDAEVSALVQKIVYKTTEAARENDVINSDGVVVIRHVLHSVMRDQTEALFTHTLAVTQETPTSSQINV
ncbi:hypothetical protein LEN26_015967 [Aphanomyces euteiches]|nr:hypothetical protein LEN26_015967 [Aphanomyces euteiches]KAH9115173.1 hypothetical protein AeMF1_010787 [Aphanomyces euteiches]KAH9195172.1 hypothetical protein AeNC1_002843 [Aphanomyces euteiches]